MVLGLFILIWTLVSGVSMANKLLAVVAKISRFKSVVRSLPQAIAMHQDIHGQIFMITITQTALVTGKQDQI